MRFVDTFFYLRDEELSRFVNYDRRKIIRFIIDMLYYFIFRIIMLFFGWNFVPRISKYK